MRNYNTISAVVKSAITDREDTGTHNYQLYLKFALEGLREFQHEIKHEVKTVSLPMNDYKAVDLPEDYVDWVKVAIQIGDRIFTMGVATDISLHHSTDECGNPISNTPVISEDWKVNGINFNNYGGYYLNNYYNVENGQIGRLYSVGGGIPYREKFRINTERRQIQFDSSIPTTCIYLEYITDGFNPNEETIINPYIFEYLRTYIHYRRVEGNDNIAMVVKEEKMRNMYYAKKNATGKISSLSVRDIINSSRKAYRLTNKI